MGKSVNTVVLLGHVGRDPEIRSSSGGTLLANLSLATSDRQKDAQGNWQDKAEWHNLVAFGRTAEIIRDYVKKGSKVYVEGRLQTRNWEDKDTGKKVYKTEVAVREIILLDGKPVSEGWEADRESQPRPYPPKSNFAPKSVAVEEDEIPF